MIRRRLFLVAICGSLAACAGTGGVPDDGGGAAPTPSSRMRETVPLVAAIPETPAEPEAPAVSKAPPDAAQRAAAARLDGAVRAALRSGMARKDRYVYAMDVAPLLLYAAQRRDAALYQQVLPFAQKLVLDSPDDPYTQGFVVVRGRDGAAPSSSGAPDMLWMARALWAGASAFDRDDDRALARKIIAAYERHGYELQGVWLARHAFDFATRTFSGWSILPDYHADFLQDAGAAGMAERSRAVIVRALAPSRLLKPLIEPEIGATYAGAGFGDSIAPNGLTPLEDSCLGVEGMLASKPAPARDLLRFVARQSGGLRAFYTVTSGAAATERPATAAAIACLTRVASTLDDGAATSALDRSFTAALRAAGGTSPDLGAAGTLLLAAHARGNFAE